MVAGFEPGAADASAYESRPHRAPRSERPERSDRTPRAKPSAPRDRLFDAPYVPSSDAAPATPAAPVRGAPKKQVAALFRSPPKPDTSGQ